MKLFKAAFGLWSWILCGGVAAAAEPLPASEAVVEGTSFEVHRRRGVVGQALGWGSPGLWLVGVTTLSAGFAVGYSSQGDASAAPWILGGLGTMGLARLSAVTGSSLLATSSLRGAEVLGASGTPVGRAAGWVALGGAAAQGVALAGQVASPRSLAPHALLSLFPEEPTRGARWARLGMVGWGTSMVAGTIQHRRNVRAAGPRAEEEPTTHRIELRLVPTGRGVQVAGRF